MPPEVPPEQPAPVEISAVPGMPGAQDEESAPAPAPPVEPDSPPPTSAPIDESPSSAPPAPLLEELPPRLGVVGLCELRQRLVDQRQRLFMRSLKKLSHGI